MQFFERLRARGLSYWADPMHSRPFEINHNDGGRGVYWNDPNGHYFEIITRPYGSQRSDLMKHLLTLCCVGLMSIPLYSCPRPGQAYVAAGTDYPAAGREWEAGSHGCGFGEEAC